MRSVVVHNTQAVLSMIICINRDENCRNGDCHNCHLYRMSDLHEVMEKICYYINETLF